jgi:hypothetical protein
MMLFPLCGGDSLIGRFLRASLVTGFQLFCLNAQQRVDKSIRLPKIGLRPLDEVRHFQSVLEVVMRGQPIRNGTVIVRLRCLFTLRGVLNHLKSHRQISL